MFTSWVNSKSFLALKQQRQLQPSVALETALAQGEVNIFANGLRIRVLHPQNTRKSLFPDMDSYTSYGDNNLFSFG